LGLNCQGRNSYVKVRHKQDNLGLGANEYTNDCIFKTTMLMYHELLSRIGRGKNDGKSEDNADKESDDSDSDSSRLSDTNVTTAFRRFEARTSLYGRFGAATDLSCQTEDDKREIFAVSGHNTNPSVAKTVSIAGFTERDQTAYAEHVHNLANLRPGKQGLGYGNTQANINSFRFGKFVSSGHLEKEDILHEHENKESLQKGQVIELGNKCTKDVKEIKEKKTKKNKLSSTLVVQSKDKHKHKKKKIKIKEDSGIRPV